MNREQRRAARQRQRQRQQPATPSPTSAGPPDHFCYYHPRPRAAEELWPLLAAPHFHLEFGGFENVNEEGEDRGFPWEATRTAEATYTTREAADRACERAARLLDGLVQLCGIVAAVEVVGCDGPNDLFACAALAHRARGDAEWEEMPPALMLDGVVYGPSAPFPSEAVLHATGYYADRPDAPPEE